ncbi:hypothetical protein [Pseudolactococcus insecticola]|uniref:Uncharacterized protein n=1 Tax=Pseudolactococcus insecticola TaxID=2709158 RepID=A0A6A0BA10_9LACT|nr:hypothetical protein [Lactococcus insecticola]GFH41291.1 hypothetical protein Hs20B_16890 [Lactococcus insecticola]
MAEATKRKRQRNTLNIKLSVKRNDDEKLFKFFEHQSLPDQLIKIILNNYISKLPNITQDIMGELIESATQYVDLTQNIQLPSQELSESAIRDFDASDGEFHKETVKSLPDDTESLMDESADNATTENSEKKESPEKEIDRNSDSTANSQSIIKSNLKNKAINKAFTNISH